MYAFYFNALCCLVLLAGYDGIVKASHQSDLNENNNEVAQTAVSVRRIRRSDHHYHHHDSHSHHDDTVQPQYCILYSDVEGDVSDGASMEVQYDISDLEELGWKQVVSSVECYGFWIIYKQPAFNSEGTGGVGYIFHDKPTFVPFTGELWAHWDDLVVGLRHVGPRIDPFVTDSITVYEHEWFSGDQYYSSRDIPKLPLRLNDKTSSVVITGASDWTIYEHAEFRGKSECLRHEDDNSTAITALLVLDNKVTSIKKGCTSH